MFQIREGTLVQSNASFGLIPNKAGLIFYIAVNDTNNFRRRRFGFINYELVHQSPEGPFAMTNASNFSNFYPTISRNSITSFTLSFYLHVDGSRTTTIFQSGQAFSARFTILAFGLNLKVHDISQTIPSITFYNVLRRNQWTFIALAYDSAQRLLKLYDGSANEKQNGDSNFDIIEDVNGDFAVRSSDYIEYSEYSIACISLHNICLSQMDIAMLPCACQFNNRLAT